MKRQLTEWEKISANDMTDQEVNIKNIQIAHSKKNKKNQKKMGRRPEETFFQRRHTDG